MITTNKGIYLLFITITLLLIRLNAGAQTAPALINYQGKLTDASGAPLANGTYGVAIRLWSKKDNGQPGNTLVWGQEYNVAVANGVFNLILGAPGGTPVTNTAVNDLNFAFNEAERYVGLTVTRGTNGILVTNATEIVPRQQVLSAPYALRAQVASNLVTSPIPPGLVSMWSGSISNIPLGWALCDGSNGTPDLRDRFIVGARQDQGGLAMTTVKGSPMRIGGVHEVTLTVEQIPPHTHSYKETPWTGSRYDGSSSPLMTQQQNSTTGSTGGGQPHENCPPFFALAFIMKLP